MEKLNLKKKNNCKMYVNYNQLRVREEEEEEGKFDDMRFHLENCGVMCKSLNG